MVQHANQAGPAHTLTPGTLSVCKAQHQHSPNRRQSSKHLLRLRPRQRLLHLPRLPTQVEAVPHTSHHSPSTALVTLSAPAIATPTPSLASSTPTQDLQRQQARTYMELVLVRYALHLPMPSKRMLTSVTGSRSRLRYMLEADCPDRLVWQQAIQRWQQHRRHDQQPLPG